MRALSTVFFLVIAATMLAACTHNPVVEEPTPQVVNEETSMEGGTAEPTEGEAMAETSVTVENGQVALTADNFTYDVTEIRVKAGEPLTMAVTNAEGFHDLVIDELEVNSGMIPAGETKELLIPTDKPGTYEYYCSVGEHRQMGMKGMLIIE